MERRHVVVTGLRGHLGSELARNLAAAAVEVHGLTQSSELERSSTLDRVTFHHLDGETCTITGIFKSLRPAMVFHLAGLSRRAHSTTDVVPFNRTNILFGAQVLEAMHVSGCRRLVTVGTYLQYFRGQDRRPMNLYAATKQSFERLAEYYADAFGISTVRLALSDVYSERDTRRNLMTDVAKAWSSNEALVLQNPNAFLDPLHVEDAAGALLAAARILEVQTHDSPSVTRYSVSSGSDVSAIEVIAAFERIGGKKLSVVHASTPPPTREMRPWRGAQVPGWAPQISLEQGIARIIARARPRQ